MDAPVTINSYQPKKPCAARFEAEQASSFIAPTGNPTGRGKEGEAQSGRPPPFPPMSAPPPPSYPSLAAPPLSHPGSAASSTRFRVLCFAVNLKLSLMEEIISAGVLGVSPKLLTI